MQRHRTIKKRQLGVELQTPIAERQGVCFRPHLPQGVFLGPLLFQQDHHYLDSDARDSSGEFQTTGVWTLSESERTTCEAERRNAARRWESKLVSLADLSLASWDRFGSIKTKRCYYSLHISTDFIGFNSSVVTYPHRRHHTLEDAASTSRTSLSPLSVCLCQRCPRCTERTPECGSFNTRFIHLSDLTENLKKTEEKILTCLVFAAPKFLMYISYSFTGGRSKMEKVMEKSRSIRRSSSSLRFLPLKVDL